MQNVLESLPSQVSPEAMNASPAFALKTGSISYASDLFKAFTDDDLENTKLVVIRSMSVMTCDEFKKECSKAQDLADETDALNGFKATDKPVSMEQRYGIKRRVLNQRLSEAKRLFGVFKQAPDVLKEKGYAAALIAARTWLADNGKTWEGDTALTSAEKAAKTERKALAKAIGNAVAEGIALESAVEVAKQEVREKAIQALCDKLVKDIDGDMLVTACLRILESQDIGAIDDAIAYLSEAKMLAMSDNVPESE